MFPLKIYPTLLAVSTLSLGVTLLVNQPTKAQSPSLVCETNSENINVLNIQGSESTQTVLRFLPEYFDSEQAAQEACNQAATKLYTLGEQGKEVDFLTADKTKGQPLVCAVYDNASHCDSYKATEIFAFKSDLQDPVEALFLMQSENPEQTKRDIEAQRTIPTIYPDVRPWWQELFGVK
jgi:hypothetical protein